MDPGINRYIMECKCKCAHGVSDHARPELIDTLWNVNWKCWWVGNKRMEELIDTLWNVNVAKIV